MSYNRSDVHLEQLFLKSDHLESWKTFQGYKKNIFLFSILTLDLVYSALSSFLNGLNNSTMYIACGWIMATTSVWWLDLCLMYLVFIKYETFFSYFQSGTCLHLGGL
jgi:hypothetical protein